jgi:methionine-rich copper-binding protein CopC
MRSVKNVVICLSAFFLFLLPANPSMAHTEVDSTSPAANETIAPGEQLVSVTFNDKVSDLANSTEFVIVDPSGSPVRADCTGVDGKGIYTYAFLPTEGDYEVTWRTVAEDGHPVSGKFSFSVSGNAETQYTAPSCATDTPTAEPTPTAIAMPLAAGAEEKEVASEGLSPFVTSGVALVAVAFVAWLLFRKKAGSKE